jgi:hypothetical protein
MAFDFSSLIQAMRRPGVAAMPSGQAGQLPAGGFAPGVGMFPSGGAGQPPASAPDMGMMPSDGPGQSPAGFEAPGMVSSLPSGRPPVRGFAPGMMDKILPMLMNRGGAPALGTGMASGLPNGAAGQPDNAPAAPYPRIGSSSMFNTRYR